MIFLMYNDKKHTIISSEGFSLKIAGIICEYNPFHNGHKYQIEMLKKEYDAIVCIMSGSFVQRGDVAIFNKWTRAKACLMSGCDLVIELPVVYSLSSAQGFAKGAVSILDKTNVIDALSFGSESGNIHALIEVAAILKNETEEVSEKIRNIINQGYSYPVAREKAYEGIIDTELIKNPNNILATEYIISLMELNSTIKPITHTRSDFGYHSDKTTKIYSSASNLRNMMKENKAISSFVPFDFDLEERYNLDKLSDIFKYKLIQHKTDAFRDIADMEPGLDNRFLSCINHKTISEILEAVKTKRYTHTRLGRIVCNLLLGITKDTKRPEYIRVLGMSETGKKILSEIKQKTELPIINKVADYKGEDIKTDLLATDISALCADRPIPFGRDYTTSPVIL